MDFDLKKLYHELDPETRRTIDNEIDKRVRNALTEEDKEVSIRRRKLKELYQQETKKALQQKLETEENRYETMKRKIIDIETKRERERQELVEQKRVQQKFLNCEPIRSVLSKQHEKAIRRDQWWQIESKMAESEKKAKEDELYHELILQNVREAMKLEEELIRKKWETEINVRNGYQQQIEEKGKRKEIELKQKDEERLQATLLMQQVQEEQEQERRVRKRKMMELDSEIKEMIERERATRRKRLEEEKAMKDEIDFIAASHKGIDKDTLRRELDNFNTHLAEFTAKRHAEEKRFDEKLEELIKDKEEKMNAEKIRLQAARTELLKSVLQGREEQMRRKSELARMENELRAYERHQVAKEIEKFHFEKSVEERNEMEKKKQYREELKKQIEERKQRQLQDKITELREKEMMLAEQAKLEEELKRLSVDPPSWNKHPLRGVKCATHYVPVCSSKKGLSEPSEGSIGKSASLI